jgi:hypothetical protein
MSRVSMKNTFALFTALLLAPLAALPTAAPPVVCWTFDERCGRCYMPPGNANRWSMHVGCDDNSPLCCRGTPIHAANEAARSSRRVNGRRSNVPPVPPV